MLFSETRQEGESYFRRYLKSGGEIITKKEQKIKSVNFEQILSPVFTQARENAFVNKYFVRHYYQ